MTRWTARGLVLAAVLTVVATACQPPPPPYYQPSKVLDFSISESVVAGDDLTVTVTASDDVAIRAFSVGFTVPETVAFQYDGFSAAPIITCDIPTFEPQPLVSVEFTCATPDWAPNGAWIAQVVVHDGGDAYETRASAPFELSGGSDDVSPPTVVSYQASPDPVVVGETVSFTVRVTDEHPLHFSYRHHTWQQRHAGWIYCEETARTVFAPNDVEVTTTCPTTNHVGTAESTIMIRDVLGNTLRISDTLEVVAG